MKHRFVVALTLGILATLGGASAHASDQSVALCAGQSVASNGGFTFSGGGTGILNGTPPSSICSIATTVDSGIPPVVGTPGTPSSPPVANGDTDPFDNAGWVGDTVVGAVCQSYTNILFPCGPWLAPESLVVSTLNLSGTGDFSCATGNGSLESPSLSNETGTGQNVLSTEVGYPGIDNSAYIVWNASFTAGIGQLTGTLYGADQSSATPEPVSGLIVVNCNDPSGGALPNAVVGLSMPSMPLSQ
ncbi:MAG: hypothetical protein ACYDCC_07760 [Actinomycetota bacterium]